MRTKLAVITIFISQVMDENEGWGDSPRALLLPGGIKKSTKMEVVVYRSRACRKYTHQRAMREHKLESTL